MARYTMLACGCLLLWVSLPLDAQSISVPASERLECVLPESTLAVMVIPHLHATRERLQHSISTCARIKPLQPFLQSISNRLQAFEDSSGILLADLGSIFQASFAIALLDIEIPEITQRVSWRFPEVLLAAEVTDSKEALQHLLEEAIRRHLLVRSSSIQFQVKTIQGITLGIVSNSQFRFAYTFLDQVFLLTTNPDYLERLIAARQPSVNNKPSDLFTSLFNADVYNLTRQLISQDDHDVRLFVNVRQLWHKLHETYHNNCMPSAAAETQKDALLCIPPPLRSLTWLFSLKKTGGHERIFWEIDRQEDQPVSSDYSCCSPARTMKNGRLISDLLVPANVLYYRAWQFDRFGWRQCWKHYIHSFLPALAQEKLAFQIQKLEQTLQLRIESDLLPAFGQEIAIACYDPSRRLYIKGQEASLENFPCTLFIGVDQQERIEQLIESMVAIPVSKMMIQETPVYQLDFPGSITTIRLYAAFIHDFLAITSSRRGLQQIISVAQQGGALASLPEYAALSTLFAQKCYAKSYLNLSYFLRRVDSLQAPAAEKVGALPAFLTGLLSVTTRTSAGMLTESFSTLGGSVIGTGVIVWCLLHVW